MAAFILSSCQPAQVANGKRVWSKYFDKTLKDPSSFKVYNEKYEVINDNSVRWTLDYGAKNSYGAMERRTVTFTTTCDLIDIDGDLIDSKDL